jgi:hypothetical protein
MKLPRLAIFSSNFVIAHKIYNCSQYHSAEM